MKTRHVYSTTGMNMVKEGMRIARRSGIAHDDISLIARDDIELEAIPGERKVVTNDFYPAAARGTPIGLTLAGAGAMAPIGASMGA
jgi:hypothetical protein